MVHLKCESCKKDSDTLHGADKCLCNIEFCPWCLINHDCKFIVLLDVLTLLTEGLCGITI